MSETSEKLDHTLRAYGRLERKHGERGRDLTAVKAERDAYKAALKSIVAHADMAADETWEDAYVEVTAIARSVLAGESSTTEE